MPLPQLTSTRLTDLSELLRQRYSALAPVVERELHVDGTSEIAVTTASDADWTAADVDADTSIARAERDSSELTEIASALDRIQAGRYGVCEACGKDIDYTRLLAHPAARRCLSCQQTLEAKPASSIGISGSSR